MHVQTFRPVAPRPYVTATEGPSRLTVTREGDWYTLEITSPEAGRGSRSMEISVDKWREFLEQMGQLPA